MDILHVSLTSWTGTEEYAIMQSIATVEKLTCFQNMHSKMVEWILNGHSWRAEDSFFIFGVHSSPKSIIILGYSKSTK